MKRYMAWTLSLIFYISLLPWNMAGAEYFNVNARNLVVSESPYVDVRAYIPAALHAGIVAGTDNTDLKAYIDNAIDTGKSVYAPDGTYMTSGNHTIDTRRFYGGSKIGTVFKRISGKNPIFKVTGDGALQHLTVDGNSLHGSGVIVSTSTYPEYSPSIVQDVLIKNCKGDNTTYNITGATSDSSPVVTIVGHPFSVGDMVRFRNVGGFRSNSNADRDLLNETYRVTAATASTITISENSMDTYTAYTSGGTAEYADYGMVVEQITGQYAAYMKRISDVDYRNNYGHLFLGYVGATAFDRLKFFGFTTGYSVYISDRDTAGVSFNDTYFESGIATGWHGIRDVWFNNSTVYLRASQAWDRPFYYSYGANYQYGTAGGEIAGVTFDKLRLYRLVNDNTNPIFDTNNYQMTIRNMHILEYASTNWRVFRDRGTYDLSIEHPVIESPYAWKFFYEGDAASNTYGGNHTEISNVKYTQGVNGDLNLYCMNEAGGGSPHISVKRSTVNISVQDNTTPSSPCRGYWLENITGDIDLTYADQGGTFIFNHFGTLTDPNNAGSLEIPNDGSGVKIGGGDAILKHISKVVALDFTALAANTCETKYMTVSGASDGNTVTLGIPTALSAIDNTTFTGYVFATDNVAVRRCNVGSTATSEPASANVRADVWKH